jgi:UDP-3-O-[3-hydroxymyristoyl] glucosamine N-acyltransferase
MAKPIGEIAAAVGAQVVGDGKVAATGVASIAAAGPGDMVFVEDARHLDAALKSRAAAVITGKFAEGVKTTGTLLLVAHPRLAFARAAAMLGGRGTKEKRIHPTAAVHASARVGRDVSVGPCASIGSNVAIGSGTSIGAGCAIADDVEIGESCDIYPNVTIYSGTRLRNRVVVHAGAVLGSDGFGYVRDPASGRYEKFPQIGRLEIEDDVEIGANTTIDRGALETTRIGRGAKIDNLVHIGHNCRIGENVIIAAQAGFSGSVVIEDNVVIGGQVGIGEHAHIEEGVMLGGQAGVLPKKILRGRGLPFWGTPAKPLKEYLRELAALARIGKIGKTGKMR